MLDLVKSWWPWIAAGYLVMVLICAIALTWSADSDHQEPL